MNALWWSSRGTGDISIELTSYKGGTMSLSGTDFVNSGGSQVSKYSIPINVVTQNQGSLISGSQNIARVSYDKTTNTASITSV